MSTNLYEEFFLHFFVNPELYKFTYLEEKFKQYQSPGLDHPKKASELGYLKNYKQINSKYLCYVPNEKVETKFTVNAVMEIIEKVYAEYAIFFQKGGAYRMVLNSRPSQISKMRKLKSYIQEMTLLKLCEKFHEFKAQFKSLDRLVMGFFFTLNYIKTCNIDVKGFCALLNAEGDDQVLNIQNVFGNFLIERLGYVPDQDSNLDEPEYLRRHRIKVKKFERILKILSKDDQLTNISLLTQQHNRSTSNIITSQFSTIKSSQLRQQQQIIVEEENLRSVVALQIFMNFMKDNRIKLTQIKIFKLLKLAGLVKSKEQRQEEQNKRNVFANLKTWEEVLNFCFQNNSLKQSEEFMTQNEDEKFDRLPYEKILLMELCKVNFIISEKLFPNQNCFQTLEAYREETYDFILTYLSELYEGKNEAMKENYHLLQKLKQIYNFGEIPLKPLVKKILKLPQIHQIYLKYMMKESNKSNE